MTTAVKPQLFSTQYLKTVTFRLITYSPFGRCKHISIASKFAGGGGVGGTPQVALVVKNLPGSVEMYIFKNHILAPD